MTPRFSGLPAVKYSPFLARHITVYRTSSVLLCSLIQLSLPPAGNAGNLYGFHPVYHLTTQSVLKDKTTNQSKNNVRVTTLIQGCW